MVTTALGYTPGTSNFSGDYDDLTNKPTLFSGNYNDLTNKPDLSIYAESADLATVATSGSYNDLSNKPSLATVATTGDYDDLINKPDVATKDDIYYKNGDKFITRNNFNVTGYVTSSGKFIGFMIAVPKLLTNITSITINKMAVIFRGIGGYVNGNAYIDYSNTSGYSVLAAISEDNQLYIGINATNAYSSVNNNTPINIQAGVGGIEVTFNE